MRAPAPGPAVRRGPLVHLLLPLVLAGCAEAPEPVRVFAAASLREAMEDAAAAWDGPVRVTSAGSQVLAHQIAAGAPASVFAPASEAHAEAVAERLDRVRPLACNALVLAVAPSSDVQRFEDLPRASRLVLGTPEVPVGAYAETVLARAAARFGDGWRRRVRARVVSREIDARQVLAKVTMGEADAALVYRTDAAAAGDAVRAVPIPEAIAVRPRYPVAVVSDGPAAADAADFVRWLRAEEGFSHLAEHGFVRCAAGEDDDAAR
ncbi:MAG TPA: molybdate ABC transporter substrate-binding protein [Sandaracinaceae bacterium LLY-WYZ-13_1]|nr:molybdate ABC transporter substrate-binding protein [Sandaracinaceae bacterium LLY-WYZ-13_1]